MLLNNNKNIKFNNNYNNLNYNYFITTLFCSLIQNQIKLKPNNLAGNILRECLCVGGNIDNDIRCQPIKLEEIWCNGYNTKTLLE